MTADLPDIRCHLDAVLENRQMTLTELARRVDITLANLSVLKNDRAKAVRFATLAAICRELQCQPGDLFSWEPPGSSGAAAQPERAGGSRVDDAYAAAQDEWAASGDAAAWESTAADGLGNAR